METTTNYGLKVYEGTDKFNPLTVENYNTEQIDEKMKANEDAGIGTATEIKGGIVHAITRANGDIPMFRFTATSNYESGDAFTVDGVNVTALTSTGETLDDGAYVIGAEVLCCLVGTRLTVFVGQTSISHASDSDKLGNQLPSYYAQTSWIGALSDLITTVKTNIVSAINELATSIASLITNKQDKNDNSLTTTSKTIVGGINELESAVTPVAITNLSGSAGVTINAYACYRIGKLVVANLKVALSQAGEHHIYGLPAPVNKSNNNYVPVVNSNPEYVYSGIVLYSGTLEIRSNTNVTVDLNVVYVTE